MRSCLGKQHIAFVNKNIVTCQWLTLNKFVSVAGVCPLGVLTFLFHFFFLYFLPHPESRKRLRTLQAKFKTQDLHCLFVFFSLSKLEPYPRLQNQPSLGEQNRSLPMLIIEIHVSLLTMVLVRAQCACYVNRQSTQAPLQESPIPAMELRYKYIEIRLLRVICAVCNMSVRCTTIYQSLGTRHKH